MDTKLSLRASGTWEIKDIGRLTRDLTSILEDITEVALQEGIISGNNPVLKSKKKDEYLTERLTEESTVFLKKGIQINPSYSIYPTTTFTHRFSLTENASIIIKKRLKGFQVQHRLSKNTQVKPACVRIIPHSPQWSRLSMTALELCWPNWTN